MRGSTPCPCDANRHYGGNTSCAVLESPGHDPIVLDLGTGLRQYGQTWNGNGPFRGTALVTHIHWDHVQGLPFFVPVLRPGAEVDIYGPPQDGASLDDAMRSFLTPPYFPVGIDDLPGKIRFHDVHHEDFSVGSARVRARPVPHVGSTNGYRVELGGASVAYVSDHQMPPDGSIAPEVLELVDGVDLLIHDAQYTSEEFAARSTWGHCTVGYAVDVAVAAGARRLALFHHDPAHDDATIDDLATQAAADAGDRVEEIFPAFEGLTVVL